MAVPKRLRMFAGPNGSGKSTIFDYISKDTNIDTGVYVNADDIEKRLRAQNCINLHHFDLTISYPSDMFVRYIQGHTLYQKVIAQGLSVDLDIKDNIIWHKGGLVHSYQAAIIADFIRYQLIDFSKKMSFETVMSHRSKVDTLEQSRKAGYKNYLYFVSTESERININRVRARVQKGGHHVPKDKIIKRYHKSLALIISAVKQTHRAYIFDNSGKEAILILEIHNGTDITLKSTIIPEWVYTYVLRQAEKIT